MFKTYCMFAVVMTGFTDGVKQGLPCTGTILFADNAVIYSESMEQVEECLERVLNLFASDSPKQHF